MLQCITPVRSCGCACVCVSVGVSRLWDPSSVCKIPLGDTKASFLVTVVPFLRSGSRNQPLLGRKCEMMGPVVL